METAPAKRRYSSARPVRRPRLGRAQSTPAPASKTTTADLWAEYRRTGDPNPLTERHLPMVEAHARRLYARAEWVRFSNRVPLDEGDLLQVGVLGLRQAIAGYDPEAGASFATYAVRRVIGAMRDHLREMDWVPRMVRHRTSVANRVRDSTRARTGREPGPEDLARALKVSVSRFAAIAPDTSPPMVCAASDADGAGSEHGWAPGLGDRLVDGREEDPLLRMCRSSLFEYVTRAMPRVDRLIVLLYYAEGMTMKEIAATLDLSESRVSQLHASILLRLKARMRGRREEFT